MNFTDDQMAAIKTTGSDLLVAAAAGSGKTAVLVERIIRIVCSEEKPVDIDRLLVVTFTDAAASEMRQRISAAIDRELSSDPYNGHLARQSMLLNVANISTIHAFCSRIVRKYFHLTDLDPSYRVADQTETGLLKAQAMEELFEEAYAEGSEDFYNLVECYGGGKTRDDNLENIILAVHELIESSPYPEECMRRYVEMFRLDDESGIDGTPWASIIKDEISCMLEGVVNGIEMAESIATRPSGPERYTEALNCDRLAVNCLQESLSGGLDDVYKAFSEIKYVRLYTYRGKAEVSEELKETAKKIREKEIKERLNKIRKSLLFKSPSDMAEDIVRLYPVVRALGAITMRFREKYNGMKRASNVVDFSDLEQYAVRIVTEEGSSEDNPIPSQTAHIIREKYVEIFIDEYQDSSPVQELILSCVAGTEMSDRADRSQSELLGRSQDELLGRSQSELLAHATRFMVGDIKQSIYRFRRARPSIFIDKYERYASIRNVGTRCDSGEDIVKGVKIDLSMNYRSRKNVIESVNFFFRRLMSREVGEIEYDDSAALYAGAVFPGEEDNDDYRTEIHIIDGSAMMEEAQSSAEAGDPLEELSKIRIEAGFIAKRVNELVNGENRLYVMDHGEYRTCRYGDIVILARSVTSIAGIMTEELKKYDIPGFADLSTGFFETIEIMTMLSFLQIIDNPLQDIHVITVLHSPVYGLNADELLAVRSVDRKTDFYNCVIKYLALYGQDAVEPRQVRISILERFMADLERWRRLSVIMSIHELLTVVYDETGYLNYTGAMPGGGIRQANLHALSEKAVQYENSSYKGLFHFIRYIERLRKSGADAGAGEAKILPENEDMVRIMTIHKSKGLEFPVVIVSMAGGNFNKGDERENIVLHQDLGLGPKYIDPADRTRTDTIARLALAKKIHRENLSEELRVLYVAMTRAKEKLIFTGYVTKLENKLASWNRFGAGKLPAYYLLDCDSYMDWIMSCVAGYGWPQVTLDDQPDSLAASPRDFDGRIQNVGFEVCIHDKDIMAAFGISGTVYEEHEQSRASRAEGLLRLLDGGVDGELWDEIDRKLSWVYPYESEMNLPSKISTSEIKRIYYSELIKDSVEMESIAEKPVFGKPSFLLKEEGITPVRRGTAMHTVVENLDLQEDWNAERVKALIENLVERNILTADEGCAVPVDSIMGFVRSETGLRIRRAGFVRREMPFVMGLRPDEIYVRPEMKRNAIGMDTQDSDADSEIILVHGIIDCFFEEDGEMVIVDYKSDYVTPDRLEYIKEKYAPQLSVYRKAVERSTGKRVKECVLYLFGLNRGIAII